MIPSKPGFHTASFHEGKKTFECTICNALFTRNSHLRTHMTTVHEGKKPFKCELCSSTFTTKNWIKIHFASVHEGRKPFNCIICEKNFISKPSLNVHISSVLHEQKKCAHSNLVWFLSFMERNFINVKFVILTLQKVFFE